jgi:hypothetical protein
MKNKGEIFQSGLTPGGELAWGRRPVAFLAEQVAGALEGAPLPDELVSKMGMPSASVRDLTRSGIDWLPQDAEAVRRIGDQVVAFVQERISELLDVPLVSGPLPARPELAIRRWPGHPRNVLLRTGLPFRRERLRAANVGELLNGQGVGIRTVLEVTAFLETSASLDPEKGAEAAVRDDQLFVIGEASVRWGQPPAPLLPEALRRAFGGDALPAWLTKDLGLPSGATTIALDGSIWKRVDEVPLRVTQYLIGLMNYRGKDITDVAVLRRGWHGGDPTRIEWSTRVRNALERAGLLDEERLGRLTYGDLLAVPSLGAKSVLEFAVIAEQVSAPAANALTEEQQEALLTACYEPWADRVRADEARFRDIAPAYEGTLAELFDDALSNPQGERSLRVVESLPAVRARVAEIDCQPLDVALRSLLVAAGVPDRDIEITGRRMGWSGAAPVSLREVGKEFGITGERVRQLVGKSLGRMGPLYVPALERAIQALNTAAPLPADTAAELLGDRGIASGPFHPAGVVRAAEVFGYEIGFRLVVRDGVAYVYVPDEPGIGSILSVARREAGKVGVVNVEEVRAAIEAEGEVFAEAVVRRLLETSPRVQFLIGNWFWMPDVPPDRNRLRNTTRKMLSVTPRLLIPTIRHGLRRRYRFVKIDIVPPSDVLRAFFTAHPEFVIDDADVVSCVEPLDYRKELGDTERIFVDVLRETPSGLLDRAELEAAVTGRGVNPSTFSVYSTFSPILDHPASNVWCLRGCDVDSAAVEALRDIVATRTRPRRTIGYGWEEDGALSVTTVVTNVNSPVIGIPRAVNRYVADRRFLAVTQDGSRVGTIVVDENGNSWGYGPLLRRRGAEAGDVLTIRFDLASERATLVMADEIDLEE